MHMIMHVYSGKPIRVCMCIRVSVRIYTVCVHIHNVCIHNVYTRSCKRIYSIFTYKCAGSRKVRNLLRSEIPNFRIVAYLES